MKVAPRMTGRTRLAFAQRTPSEDRSSASATTTGDRRGNDFGRLAARGQEPETEASHRLLVRLEDAVAVDEALPTGHGVMGKMEFLVDEELWQKYKN